MSAHSYKEEVVLHMRRKVGEMTEAAALADGSGDYAPLRELGLDSLKVVQLVVHIEQHYGIVFEDEELVIDFFATIDQFAANVADKLARSA